MNVHVRVHSAYKLIIKGANLPLGAVPPYLLMRNVTPLKTALFWDMTSCILVDSYKRLGEIHCSHLFEELATLRGVTSGETVVSVLIAVISYNRIFYRRLF